MSADVVGLTVRVTLKAPREWVLEGVVIGVVDQKLDLQDVYFPKTNDELKSFLVLGTEIADLEVIPTRQQKAPVATTIKPFTLIPSSVSRPAQRSNQKPATFVDPAILSFTRTASDQIEALPVLYPTSINDKPVSIPSPVQNGKASVGDFETPPRSILKNQRATNHGNMDAITDSMASISIIKDSALPKAKIEPVNGTQELPQPIGASLIPVRSPQEKRRKTTSKTFQPNQVDFAEIEASSAAKTPSSRRKKAPGWRETPLLEQQSIEDPVKKEAKKSRRQRQLEMELKNGWATEDATDIQELGDFDFQGNLSKFDKRSVFDQLREEDTTAAEERLVSFNKALPGTFGGKNLHPSEMVLSELSPVHGLGVTGGIDSEPEEELEGSTGSRKIRPMSRAASRQSILHNQKGLGTPPIDLRRPASFSLGRVGQLAARVKSPRGHADSSVNASLDGVPSLKYTATSRNCVPAAPEALDAIEAVAKNISGLSEDILSENAGRGIAEVALSALNPGGRRLTGNHNAQPVVVVLVGDNRAGARALAAARHLTERGVRIVACTTGPSSTYSETYAPYSDILGPQIQRLGKGHLPWSQATVYLKTLNAPPELIIDGLLGTNSTFEELDDVNAGTAEDMLDWANRSRANVLAVDIPSGVNAKTGEVQVMEGEPLEVRAKMVVCCGAPVTGLLKAMEVRHAEEEHDWRVFICDIGINSTWRDLSKGKDKIRGGKPIAFGGEWVVGVRFDAGSG